MTRFEPTITTCPICGKEFMRERSTQYYCSDYCRLRAKYLKNHPNAERGERHSAIACNRVECFAYNERMKNNCDALSKLNADLLECKFYKTKEEYKAQLKKLKEKGKI